LTNETDTWIGVDQKYKGDTDKACRIRISRMTSAKMGLAWPTSVGRRWLELFRRYVQSRSFIEKNRSAEGACVLIRSC